MPTPLAYVMDPRRCGPVKSLGDPPELLMLLDILDCYVAYFEKTQTAKIELYDCLEKVTNSYNWDPINSKLTKI